MTKPPIRPRVLIAEDQPVLLAALADVVKTEPTLQLAGTARNTQEAVEIAKQHRPDVALLDVKMPGGGGSVAAREIKALLPKTKILALSASGDREDVLGMLRAGAAGYLLKDVDGEQLVRAIGNTMSGQAVLSRQLTAQIIEELVRLLERAEEVAEELRALERTKSELIQVLSHELLTPAAVMHGAVLSIARQPQTFSEDEVRELTESAKRASARLKRIVGNVTAAASLGREGATVATRPLSLESLFEEVASDFPHDRGRIVFPSKDGVGELQIRANKDLIRRAAGVLIENALAFTPESETIEVDVHVHEHEVAVAVSDRGPGVPAELRDLIFEPFAQVDSSATRSHQGLGIGLYLARRIIEAHGGRIEVLDRAGGGSTFLLAFPRPQDDRTVWA